MLSFTPPPKLEKELKRLQGLLAETCKELENLEPDEETYLRRCAFISNIGASTRIENAVLTDQEIDWVDTILTEDGKTTAFEAKKQFILDKIRDKLSKDKERSLEEVVGCREMLNTLYLEGPELYPLMETDIRGLHHDLLRYYPKATRYAGSYKESPNRVVSRNHDTGEERVVLEPAPPGLITKTAMADLLAWYNATIREYPWPILTATEFVFRFLAIHPFQDGNGRLGRALFSLALIQSDDKYLAKLVPLIAIDRRIEQIRPQYYTVLHKASGGQYYPDSTQYDLAPVAWFFLKMVEAALDDITIYRNRYANLKKLTETARSVLNCFKNHPEKRLKIADIEAETELPRRTVQYALKSLTESAFLQILGRGAGSRYQLVF